MVIYEAMRAAMFGETKDKAFPVWYDNKFSTYSDGENNWLLEILKGFFKRTDCFTETYSILFFADNAILDMYLYVINKMLIL